MYLLITYDINTTTKKGEKRLRNIAKLCKAYGQRVQKSVFECKVSDTNYATFKDGLLKIINGEKDGLRIYHLHGDPNKIVEEYGKGRSIDYEKPLVL